MHGSYNTRDGNSSTPRRDLDSVHFFMILNLDAFISWKFYTKCTNAS